MSSSPLLHGRPDSVRGSRRHFVLFLSLWLFAASSFASEETADDSPAEPESTFLDTVTVAATRSEATVKDTPGQVDVITSDEIEELGHTSISDLLRYTPGVYVDGDLTRLGSNGFNIRGIGGNRVLTQIDGVPTPEQFDFGPFSVTQTSLDVDLLENVEIVRSAGSALYGSDALGGVVSLTTRSPGSYLSGDSQFMGFKTGFDSRSSELAGALTYARGSERWQASVVLQHRDGDEVDNQGSLASEDFTRTAANPIDRRQDEILFKLGHTSASGSYFEAAFEGFDARANTEVFSSRRTVFGTAVLDIDAIDTQERKRFSLEHSLVTQAALVDSVLWRAYFQDADTEQLTDETRLGFRGLAQRNGSLSFDQQTTGFEVVLRKDLGNARTLTYGLSAQRDDFDQLRDRNEFLVATGDPVPTSLIFPTKYFPRSQIDEFGAFVQADLAFFDGRLRLVPGLRFDDYALDADGSDTVFITGNPGTSEPADLEDDAVSPKLGAVLALNDEISLVAQYAHGFRAPPMSSVNNGFTNQAGGYRTLANPDLQPETSDNYELGLRGAWSRGSFSLSAFDNQYDDFIETAFLGFNPQVFLVEFQPQNVAEVSISGIELAGEARFGRSWRLRGAFSLIEGDNETTGEPLESIAPNKLVAGLSYRPTGGRWGFEASVTATESKAASDLPADSTQFRPSSSEVLDLAAWRNVSDRLSLQLSAWNLGDETYFLWPYVRGQNEGSATIARYSQPGRSFGLQARLNF